MLLLGLSLVKVLLLLLLLLLLGQQRLCLAQTYSHLRQLKLLVHHLHVQRINESLMRFGYRRLWRLRRWRWWRRRWRRRLRLGRRHWNCVHSSSSFSAREFKPFVQSTAINAPSGGGEPFSKFRHALDLSLHSNNVAQRNTENKIKQKFELITTFGAAKIVGQQLRSYKTNSFLSKSKDLFTHRHLDLDGIVTRLQVQGARGNGLDYGFRSFVCFSMALRTHYSSSATSNRSVFRTILARRF